MPTIPLRVYENPTLTYAQWFNTARKLQSAVKQLVEEGIAISTIDNGGQPQRSTATQSVALKEEPVAMANAVPPRRYNNRQQAMPFTNTRQCSQQATPFSNSGQCSQQATPFSNCGQCSKQATPSSNQRRITCYNCGKVCQGRHAAGPVANVSNASTMGHHCSVSQINTDAYMFQMCRSWTQQMHVDAMWVRDPTRVQLLQQNSNQRGTRLHAQNTSHIWLIFTWMVKRWDV